MIGGWASPVMAAARSRASGARALHMLLELREARALGRVQHLAPELDRDRGRVAVQRGEERHLHTLQDLGRLVRPLLEQDRERSDDAVREQDAEERADE